MNTYKNPYDLKKIKEGHKLLKDFKYDPSPVIKGYTEKTLYINVGTKEIKEKNVPEKMKELFTGGRGYDIKLLWDAVNENTKWNSPENEVVISSGPIGGTTQYPGSGKSIVMAISPTTTLPVDSNVGGYFGPYLKFSGWDALEIQGKSDEDVIIFIDGDKGKIEIYTAPFEDEDSHLVSEELTELFAETEKDRKFISTVSAGKGASNSLWGCLNFSYYDRRRKVARLKQAGRGGIGSVFRDKGIKAIVCKYSKIDPNPNQAVDLDTIKDIGAKYHKELHDLDASQNDMRHVGTAHLVDIMNEYDLLPVNNYKFGQHELTPRIGTNVWRDKFSQGMPDGCWYGCTMQCAKGIDNHILRTGPYKGDSVCIDGPEYETAGGVGSNCGIFDPNYIAEANFYCDTYGVDTITFGTSMAFVMECYEAGILNKEITGGLDLHFGNGEAALELLHRMARGEEGFPKIYGLGIRRMKKHFIENYGADAEFVNSIGMECKGMEYSEYITKESLAMQGGYGLANKGAQHDEAWLIFMDMVNNQIPTFDDKAEALWYFPIFRTLFGLLGLCKLPWNDLEPADNGETDEPAKVPEHTQNYTDIFNAITGLNETNESMMLRSERVYNFQRLFNFRMGGGTREGDKIPYRSAGPVTNEEYLSRQERYDNQLVDKYGFSAEDVKKMTTEEKVKIHREKRLKDYDDLCTATYKRRGWDNDGVPTIEKLKSLNIDFPDAIELLSKR